MADESIAIGLVVAAMPLRRRLTRLFSRKGWNSVAIEASCVDPPCDVLVVDIDRIEEVCGPAPIAAVSYGSEVRHFGDLRADVRAIVDRDDLDEAFLEAVHEVAAGHGWISPTLVRPLLHVQLPAHRPVQSVVQLPALTAREHEVAALVAQGMNNSEIADALYIAESTVKFHMSNILHKTGSRDRSQLAARMPASRMHAVR